VTFTVTSGILPEILLSLMVLSAAQVLSQLVRVRKDTLLQAQSEEIKSSRKMLIGRFNDYNNFLNPKQKQKLGGKNKNHENCHVTKLSPPEQSMSCNQSERLVL
jgi:hypothetical protein